MENDFIERLFAEHYKKLLRYAEIKLGGGHRAPDLVQDVFVKAQKNREALERSPNPAGWLINALKWRIMNEYKARGNAARLLAPLNSLSGAEPGYEMNTLFFEVRDMLSPEEWRLIQAVYIDGYSAVELSRDLGIGYEACKKRIQKALSKLRDRFGEDDEIS
ncbi:MAG: sigma-70 family RNA polymerase sigma factor [Oscillospiraceae bacterium]|jgi:RNA polymerase sigma-70 factor (ECF subfamily)|nr:sigma-70 family RNA polymerase sigma factor [Oscillospiraceae bacterium]